MSFLHVNETRCAKDGLCAAACPIGLLRVEKGKTFPMAISNADKLCLQCGHCVSVCPHGALSLATMKAEDCVPLRKELGVSLEQTAQLIKSRRSVRHYKPDPVKREDIEALIDIARYAPSGKNVQPLSWLVVYDVAKVQALAGCVADWMKDLIRKKHPMAGWLQFAALVSAWEAGTDLLLRGAPHLVIAHAPENDPMAPQSATIALTTFELAAHSAGLGACWAGFFQIAASMKWPAIQQALRLPEGQVSHGAMMLGYPAEKYFRIPTRKKPAITWQG